LVQVNFHQVAGDQVGVFAGVNPQDPNAPRPTKGRMCEFLSIFDLLRISTCPFYEGSTR
jgi:hypothetical protein